MAIQAVAHALNEIMMHSEDIESPLTQRPITMKGYIRHVLNEDPEHFQESKNFNKVLKALNTITSKMLAKTGSSVPAKIRENTGFYPYFKDCIRAIDGTHIPEMVTGRDISSYCNRHGTISQNVLAACNFDFEFIYVLSGWEGSTHDSRVLQDALTRRNGFKVPQEFGSQGLAPANEVELFNLRRSSLRNVIERCRFDEFPIELENESSSSSSLPVNEGDLKLVFQTQEQQRQNANEWKVGIALDMWRDVGHNDNNENQR
ncbi:unnamed protein product [Prunus armeniaca]